MENLVAQSKDLLAGLPAEWPEFLLQEIQAEIRSAQSKVVILDDDPTGTQTSRDIPVLTEWSVEALAQELKGQAPAFFVLTNSRSMSSLQARHLAHEIGSNLLLATRQAQVEVSVISRSDSTLRGHYPEEVDVLARALQLESLPHLLVPFFLEGGRYTVDNVHYVLEEDQLIPAAQTAFARDAAFGFSNSDLRLWVEEKTQGRVTAHQVVSVSLTDIRRGGPKKVAEIYLSVPDGGVCVINAVSYRDMEVVIKALFLAARKGRQFLARTAASYVRTRLGFDGTGKLLEKKDLVSAGGNGGLFMVGSYVEKTGRQLAKLLQHGLVQGLELDVEKLLDPGTREVEISRVAEALNTQIRAGQDTAVYTSRRLVTGTSSEESLHIGNLVSTSLIEIVRNLLSQPRYLVAKGGITSSDIATKGLKVKRAMVIGQVQPGVPVWRLGEESSYPGMSYIVYPGNVGNDSALLDISTMLAR
ncbi:MAG: four-carbon acid sugar kinase family protein [Desulfopila sp.]|jgi:uncharacterized protein YgbK (DUF1537 family)|nr:four-carbon acid sugar kinase family protein [Desulfopila sp.]